MVKHAAIYVYKCSNYLKSPFTCYKLDLSTFDHSEVIVRLYSKMENKMLLFVGFLFYGPSTYFRSFRARSVTLNTLLLGKPPRQFTNT